MNDNAIGPAAPDGARRRVVSETVVVAATPEEVYALVADPRQTRRWSPENTGATTPRDGVLKVGDRFVGANVRKGLRWSTEAQVVHADPAVRFAFRVDRWGGPRRRAKVSIATWAYELSAVEGGTAVTETWTDDRRGFADADAFVRMFDKIVTGTTFADFNRRNISRSLAGLQAMLAQSGDGLEA